MTSPSRIFANPLRGTGAALPEDDLRAVMAFAAERPATPLHDARPLAASLGLSRLWIKDETSRWGLNAFKITGVAYALQTLTALPRSPRSPHVLVSASAGNHGRALARVARDMKRACRIHVPADALPARIAAMRTDGAEVREGGSYEEAMARAARDAETSGALLVSDTVPPGDPEIPGRILRGYTRVFQEAEFAWAAPPDFIVVQGGVGGLVGAAAGWMRARLPDAQLIAAEPEGAACLRESARTGRRLDLPSTAPTSMVCLRCASPSAASWPHVAAGVDGFVGVTDDEAMRAAGMLRTAGIEAGASGACGFAALMAAAPELRGRSALVVITEGL